MDLNLYFQTSDTRDEFDELDIQHAEQLCSALRQSLEEKGREWGIEALLIAWRALDAKREWYKKFNETKISASYLEDEIEEENLMSTRYLGSAVSEFLEGR